MCVTKTLHRYLLCNGHGSVHCRYASHWSMHVPLAIEACKEMRDRLTELDI